jgi:hypothetical protein
MTDETRADPSRHSLAQTVTIEATGLFAGLARRLLGDSPGVSAFATGLLWVCIGLVLQILGSWFAGILSTDITLTRFFVMLVTVYMAVVGLILLCGVMTMLAGAIRYGVGATDR